jgi:hypothetical protein
MQLLLPPSEHRIVLPLPGARLVSGPLGPRLLQVHIAGSAGRPMAGTLGGERLVGRDDGSNDHREEECVSHLTVISKVRSVWTTGCSIRLDSLTVGQPSGDAATALPSARLHPKPESVFVPDRVSQRYQRLRGRAPDRAARLAAFDIVELLPIALRVVVSVRQGRKWTTLGAALTSLLWRSSPPGLVP